MAKRLTDSRKYHDPWFRKLQPKYKLLWDYILCTCDHAGIYKVDLDMATFCVGIDFTNEETLQHLGDRIHIVTEEVWFLPKFFMFQYGENNGSKACVSALKLISSRNLIKLLPNCYQTVKNKNKNKNKDKVKVKNKDKNKKKAEVDTIKNELPREKHKGTARDFKEIVEEYKNGKPRKSN